MIFSADKWNKASEIKQYIKVSAGLEFRTMEAPLSSAYNQFLLPLIGDSMGERLLQIYNANQDESDSNDLKLLQLCQRAVANLAFWYDFTEINTKISDSGFQRMESDSMKGVYKYQENTLRDSFRNKGFNALDQILEFIEENIERYNDFKESRTYKETQGSIVKNTAEVDQTYYIGNSRIVFLRLQPHFRMVSASDLRIGIGEKAYEHLTTGISKEQDSKFNLFRSLCAQYVILMGVARMMLETGSLTDRGLYFSSIEPGRSNDESFRPLDMERVTLMVDMAKSDAKAILARIRLFLKNNFNEFYVDQNSYLHNRDNDNKKTFFA